MFADWAFCLKFATDSARNLSITSNIFLEIPTKHNIKIERCNVVPQIDRLTSIAHGFQFLNQLSVFLIESRDETLYKSAIEYRRN